ncbi:MAG: DUF2927 domain-containing protein [Calditrichaeota bacterium]|nr:MAG: DUF2927 domain-containing protein [Calditrichota bacterium]
MSMNLDVRGWRSLCLAGMVLLLGGCTATHNGAAVVSPPVKEVPPRSSHPGTTPPSISPVVLDYFLEIAFGSEYGLGDYTIKKWKKDVRIGLIGDPTEADRRTVEKVVATLNDLLNPILQVKIVDNREANLHVYFIPQAEFYKYEPPGLVFNRGFFWAWWNGIGEIHRARVVVASDGLTQRQRSHLIWEELTQALGLMNDSLKYPDSIFYQEYSETLGYSSLDRAVIRLLYDPRILPGMRQFEVRDRLAGAP